MASEEMRKKWGTIFMGEREASVEQLNAMQEHVNRDRLQKERSEDYMERVKQRAADRAREILGAAYAERQKVLEEAKGEAAVQKRLAMQECAKIKAEGEAIRKQAREELAAAQAEREEAAKMRQEAREAGHQEGMNQAAVELHEFRAELGQAVAALMRGVEMQRRNILNNWREDLAELVKAAARAGTGYVLQKEHDAVLRQLVFQALDLLENRSLVSIRVNPQDEETVSDLFRAARERAPELKQWVVTGDDAIEPGGLVADSGSGSVDFQRANFRELVDGVLMHLGLPHLEAEMRDDAEVASIVEQEIANIASMTPELDDLEPALDEAQDAGAEPADAAPQAADAPDAGEAPDASDAADEPGPRLQEPLAEAAPAPMEPLSEEMADLAEELDAPEAEEPLEAGAVDPSLAELEDELFPLDGEAEPEPAPEGAATKQAAEPGGAPAPRLDPKTLAEGGFL